jgi:serine/threonine-protein kinase
MIPEIGVPAVIASRYRPIRLIARGGMGVVYEVEHLHTGERLALKVIASGTAVSTEMVARFQQEARASARIKSDNVVRVTDADVAPELGGAPFLVMELLEGTDLERAATTAPPAPATVVEWLRQVARAIDKAHSLSIVHRDLKPENLFLTNQPGSHGGPHVKILDFGILKMIEEGTGVTHSGQILGTPKYMAPEQASRDAPITPATDRYALGLVAYRLLVGESYYRGGVMVVLGQLLHGELQPPSARGVHLGDAFDAWFLKACHRDPKRRFASASEQIEALATALGIPAAPIERASSPSPPVTIIARRLSWLAALVAFGACAAALAARRATTTSSHEGLICGLPERGATAACGDCLSAACCKEAEECAASEGCPQLEGCIRTCSSGDAVCRARCYATNAAIAQLQRGVETCRAEHCAAECFPPRWECLGRVAWQYPRLQPRAITIKATAVCASCAPGNGRAPLAGTRVRVCSVADPNCALPFASCIADDGGSVTLNIDTSVYPPPLSVFLELRKEGYLDTLEPISFPPISGDLDVGPQVLLEPRVNVDGAATMLGTTYDPSRAFVHILPLDCTGQVATKAVAVDWLDRDARTSTTDYFGYGRSAMAINVPVNSAHLTRIVARVADTKQLVLATGVVVRAGAVTRAVLSPPP